MSRSISLRLAAPVLCAAVALCSTAYADPAPVGTGCVPEMGHECEGTTNCAATPGRVGAAGGGVVLAGVAIAAFFLHRRRGERR